MKSKISTLKKPALNAEAVRAFAEGDQSAKQGEAIPRPAPKAEKATTSHRSGLVPTGDVRLTANIREDLHLKLKIEAAKQRTTVGELIERMIEGMA